MGEGDNGQDSGIGGFGLADVGLTADAVAVGTPPAAADVPMDDGTTAGIQAQIAALQGQANTNTTAAMQAGKGLIAFTPAGPAVNLIGALVNFAQTVFGNTPGSSNPSPDAAPGGEYPGAAIAPRASGPGQRASSGASGLVQSLGQALGLAPTAGQAQTLYRPAAVAAPAATASTTQAPGLWIALALGALALVN